MENKLLNFVARFFSNLNCECKFEDEILIITKTPKSFQKFYGKNEPYKFTTNKAKSSEDIEFLEKSSYIIKTISAFLEDSGQSTLLKIDFQINPIPQIKNQLKLANSRVMKLKPKKKYDIFFRFTFHSSFQYLNERNKIINEIYVHNNKAITGDLNDYPVIEGKKTDVRIPDMKEPYFAAKEELQKRLEDKKKEYIEVLNSELSKAIERINSHFETEEKELLEHFTKAKLKLEELRKEGDLKKVDKQEKLIQNIQQKLDTEERKKDKERSILIEKNRHGLNLNNKLFNTTLIYHPIFCYDALIKNSYAEKNIEINFNPLTESLEKKHCDLCNSEINEIYLCNNGHVSCKKCTTNCESCGKEFCTKCVSNKCELCSSHICNDCKTRCFGCGKTICKTHTHVEKVTGRIYCSNCLTRCERCGSSKVGSSFKKSKKTGASICEDCYREEMQKSALKGVFDD